MFAWDLRGRDMKRLYPVCYDCACTPSDYIVKNEIWDKAFPNYIEVRSKTPVLPGFKGPIVLLCLGCLEKRLGRNLKGDDFDFSIPVNASIKLGIKIGRSCGQPSL
jgi:hypothetical protein